MSGPANSIPHADDTDSPSAWERALLDRQLETLDRLAEMGMGVAGAIHGRVTADDAAREPDTVLHHAAMDFARVSRAVRMTLALQSRLVRDFKTPPKAGSAQAKDDKDDGPIEYAVYWANGEPLTRPAKKRVLRESVRSLAEERGLDRETVERLETEALEKLERDDLYPAPPAPWQRTFHDLVGLICQDLGLKPEAGNSPLPADERSAAAQQPEDLETPRPPSSPRAPMPAWPSG